MPLARARPSKVEVPRPISSINTKDCSVALCTMAAASVISSMKVDCAFARSSAAPMRVWIASIGPSRQAFAGTKEPMPASSCKLGPIDAIHTRIGAADDLANAQSTFMLEMTEAAAIVHSATEHSLVLMDEIGRGTSTFDGLALAGAIATQLHERNRSFTLFATHYFELTDFPQKHDRAVNLHVGAVESGHDIVFLHQMESGPASRSYGVQVARLAGMPPALIRQARATLEALERQANAGSAQVDLFAAPPDPAEAAPPSAALSLLATIDPDALTPREALDALYRLKAAAS